MQNDPPKTPESATTTSPLDPSITPPPTPLPPADPSNNPFPEKPKSKVSLIIIIALGILVLGLGGYFGYQYYMSTIDKDDSSKNNAAEITQPEETSPEEITLTELDTFITDLKGGLDTEDGLTVTTSSEDASKNGINPAFYQPTGYEYFVYPVESLALYVVSDDDQATITTIKEHLVSMALEKDESSNNTYSSDSLICSVLESGSADATYVSITCADKTSYETVAKSAKPFYEAFMKSETYSTDNQYVLYSPVITDDSGKESVDGTLAKMDISIIEAGTMTAEFSKVDGVWIYNSEAEKIKSES